MDLEGFYFVGRRIQEFFMGVIKERRRLYVAKLAP